MTIREALERTDSLKYNTFTDEEKIAWLDRGDAFGGYDGSTDRETALLAAAPYDEMYIHWLAAQIDYANGEFDRYNASITMYNTAYTAWASAYNRDHMPVSRVPRLRF